MCNTIEQVSMESAANSAAQQDGDRLQERATDVDSDPLGVVVVYGELVQTGEPLTKTELAERTLLPERTVEVALAELERTDAVRVLTPRVDTRPTRYLAEQ